MDYVLLNRRGSFWTGAAWTEEYPSAALYATAPDARRAAGRAAATMSGAEGVHVVAAYGMAGQRVVETVD